MTKLARSSAVSSAITIEQALGNVPNAPFASSRSRMWPSITVDMHPAISQMELDCPPRDHHVLFYMNGTAAPTIQKRDGKTHISVLVPGSVVLMPSGLESQWYGGGPSGAKIRIPTATIDKAAEEIAVGAARSRELLNVFEIRDPILERLASLLCDELAHEDNPVQPIFVQSISTAIAAHLLRLYDTSGIKLQRGPSRLDSRSLERVLGYINDHAGSSIDLETLAQLANVSKCYFTVLFKRSTGVSPIHYVEQVKIKKAQALIKGGRMSLFDVAKTLGYADQSHFTRRFARHVGCTPGIYARQVADTRLPKPGDVD